MTLKKRTLFSLKVNITEDTFNSSCCRIRHKVLIMFDKEKHIVDNLKYVGGSLRRVEPA